MHIPDNYLSPATCAAMGAVMVPVWAAAARRVRREVPAGGVPLLGIGAAVSFLLMMFNVPLPGGTTGHAVGGTLLAVALGPWAACISLSIALLLQALMFGDGGILSFGANAFNMAFVIPFAGYALYRLVRGNSSRPAREYAGLVAGSYLAINVAALCAAIELGIQPLVARGAGGAPLYFPYPLSVSIPAMVVPHLAVAGVAEALFTVGVIAFLRRVAPGTLYQAPKANGRGAYAVLGLLVCLTPLGLLASGEAWGEWGPETIQRLVGFVPRGMREGLRFEALFPAYGVHGFPEILGYVVSAAIGAALLVIAFKLVATVWRGRRQNAEP
jgi:cobalt/nickel transport system permease protein